jgi:hypothetical protein
MLNDLVEMISQERLRNLAQLFPGGPKPLLGHVVVPSDLLEQRSDGLVRRQMASLEGVRSLHVRTRFEAPQPVGFALLY